MMQNAAALAAVNPWLGAGALAVDAINGQRLELPLDKVQVALIRLAGMSILARAVLKANVRKSRLGKWTLTCLMH